MLIASPLGRREVAIYNFAPPPPAPLHSSPQNKATALSKVYLELM